MTKPFAQHAASAATVNPTNGRPFTRSRLALCADAEAAVARAQAEAGNLVRAWMACRSWMMVHSDRPDAPEPARWRWMLEPALLAGRVVMRVSTRFAFFGMADAGELASTLPAGRQATGRLIELCEMTEEVLALAMELRVAMVLPAELHEAWTSRFADRGAPGGSAWEWKKALEPAVRAGRVTVVRRGNELYFGVNGHPACVLPAPPLPRWSDQTLSQCARTERAVESAVALTGAMATTVEVCEAWERLFGSPPPQRLRNRMYEALEPAVVLGRVRVASRLTHAFLFAPIARMELLPRPYISDMERVEEAVRRATERLSSAVLVEEVASEAERDSELRLQARVATLSTLLESLVVWDRAIVVRSRRRGGRCRKYYAMPWGPNWVSGLAEHHLDRRLRAARALWNASRGRPFTTTALRNYANSHARYRTEGDPPWAWVSALQCLHDDGELVRMAEADSFHVRWAPAREWNALAPADRDRALRDGLRSSVCDMESEPADALAPEAPLDVAFVSIAQDMRALVLHAKAHVLASESDPDRRRILRSRPVTVRDVRRVAKNLPRLVPRTGISLGVYLQDAGRTKNGHRRPPVICLGVVRNCAFYDTRATPAGNAYVAYRLALRDATPAPLRKSCSTLSDAVALHTSGVIPLSEEILDWRAEALARKIGDCRARLASACAATALLDEESAQTAALDASLVALEEKVRRLRSLSSCTPLRATVEGPLDVVEAWRSLEGLYSMPDGLHERMLSARFTVPVIRGPIVRPARRRGGRPVEIRMDRIEFIRYAHARFGNGRSGHFVAQGCHALGDLRTPEPFIAALCDARRTSAHTLAAGALGLLDDPESRDALAEYIVRACEGGERCAPGTSLPACEAAVYGLAPLPFGTLARELRENERQALRLAADATMEVQVQALGRRVLRAWDEAWNRDLLLQI
ncbi:hypothetical protein [Longimicrobium terrae]|uniref:Uncharacterized protein n=1 Tax=Longimicrobium terrae TaxID=1639882 RepID=A0A841H1F6_9BACT|nr:hypothetical protein [Longimicrobium terrae]MBB4637514.1 hypothetical protein [Longimicrobium terrae]MBB6071911.1 hypothetical protein [Longimicrobium terrae]NNC30458.1 hypothetical protein [Longimicrobium terrae]